MNLFAREALQEGRKRQSSLTDFLHYTFENPSSREAIPVYENMLFILALCRSNQADMVLEGRDLFLRFYEYFASVGAFGVYLHEWPQVRKPMMNMRILIPLLRIWLDYRHVWGDEARKKLEDLLVRLSSFVDDLKLPPLQAFQKQVFDAVFKQTQLPELDPTIAHSTMDWSEVLTVAPWLGKEIEFPWHEGLNLYAGSYLHELQRTTLLDLFFGKGAREDELTPLYGALIYDFPYICKVPEPNKGWGADSSKTQRLVFLKEFQPVEARLSPGFHLFSYALKENELVCQETQMGFSATWENEQLICEFEFRGASELDLFLRFQRENPLFVNGERATYFELGDRLTIAGFTMQFAKVAGEGRVCGHFLKGNRRGQTCPKVESEWAVYDWQINVTALEKSDDLRLRLVLDGAPKSGAV